MDIEITTEFIKLDQLLKFANIVASGSEAKYVIAEGMVTVNGGIETRRGKKIYKGDTVVFEENRINVC